jgi:hypothetical protein
VAALLYIFKVHQLVLFLLYGQGPAPWRILR